MITVKKNAIKYKNEEGNMQESGVICQASTFGEDYLPLVSSVAFKDLNVFGKSEVEVTLINPFVINGIFSTNVLNTTVEKLTFNVGNKPPQASAIFYAQKADSTLKHIVFNVDISEATNIASSFYLLYALEVIEGIPFDFSSATNVVNTFGQCRALREVRFKPSTLKISLNLAQSSQLSEASIKSIIDGLADLTGLETQTLKLHANVKSKLTEEQIESITSKNWVLA